MQPLEPMETVVSERLFLVCTPGPPPVYALKDVFGRFGGLIDVYLLKVSSWHHKNGNMWEFFPSRGTPPPPCL